MMKKQTIYRKNYLGGEMLGVTIKQKDELMLELWYLPTKNYGEISFIIGVYIDQNNMEYINQEINLLIESNSLLNTVLSIKEEVTEREMNSKLLNNDVEENLEEMLVLDEVYIKEFKHGKIIAKTECTNDEVWLELWYLIEEESSIISFLVGVEIENDSMDSIINEINHLIENGYLENACLKEIEK